MKCPIDDLKTVALDDAHHALVILDQTLLPGEVRYLSLQTQAEIYEAIYRLRVRGAPAIGVAAGMAAYLAAQEIFDQEPGISPEAFQEKFAHACAYLDSSRPTAVNLSYALSRMKQKLAECLARSFSASGPDHIPQTDSWQKTLLSALKEECLAIQTEDQETNRKIGEYALSLLKPGMGLLTHCNAGALATTKYGTATAAMYLGQERGYDFKVFCDETRPLLQGARLTAWELSRAGIDTTLLCDNMAASLMKQGKIDAVLVGCDRVAKNGDTANKIGTNYAAIAAKHYQIPFYVCAPSSTIDPACPDGAHIIIEQRPAEEVTTLWYEAPLAPPDIKVYNPAFDVTDADLITAIITEKGIFRYPFTDLC